MSAPGATTILCAAIGFAYGGAGWMFGAACIGWLVDGAFAIKSQKLTLARLTAIESGLIAIGGMINAKVVASHQVLCSISEAQSVENYDLMHLGTPRTEAEWDAVSPRVWPLIRRYLVEGQGLDARVVDRAKADLLDQHCTGNSLPNNEVQLARIVETCRISRQRVANLRPGDPAPERLKEAIDETQRIMDEKSQRD